MFQSLFGSLLNHLYRYRNENVSLRHLSWICITSILTTIYSLKNCSVHRRSCHIYSPKSFGFFRKEFRRVKKNQYVIYRLRVYAYGHVQHFQDRGHSFSPYGPYHSFARYISSVRYSVRLVLWLCENLFFLFPFFFFFFFFFFLISNFYFYSSIVNNSCRGSELRSDPGEFKCIRRATKTFIWLRVRKGENLSDF